MNFYTVTFWTSLEFPVEVEVEAPDLGAALGEAIAKNPELRNVEATIAIELEKDCS